MKESSKKKQKRHKDKREESIISTENMLCDYLLFDALDDEEF